MTTKSDKRPKSGPNFRDLFAGSMQPATAGILRRRAAKAVAVPRPIARDYSRNPPKFLALESPPPKFIKAGVNRADQRKFEKGRMAMRKFDLHGCTRDQAIHELEYQIRQCVEDNVRGLLVVVGIGRFSKRQPVLKTHVLSYLIQHDDVLAYAPARNRDGATGAVYVMLRKAACPP